MSRQYAIIYCRCPVNTLYLLPMYSQYIISAVHVQSVHYYIFYPLSCQNTTSPAHYQSEFHFCQCPISSSHLLPMSNLVSVPHIILMYNLYTSSPTHVMSVHYLSCLRPVIISPFMLICSITSYILLSSSQKTTYPVYNYESVPLSCTHPDKHYLSCPCPVRISPLLLITSHCIIPYEDSWFCPDILQSDWVRVLKQGIKWMRRFTHVWEFSDNQIPAWVIYPCLKVLSQPDCSFSDLPLVIYPSSNISYRRCCD